MSPMQSAPLAKRLIGVVYELLLMIAMLMVSGGIYQAIAGAAGVAPESLSQHRGWQSGLFVWVTLILFMYYSFCWTRSGQTLPMKTWKMRLVSEHHPHVALSQAQWRFFSLMLFILPLGPAWVLSKHQQIPMAFVWIAALWALLPYAWGFFDKDRQFLHDRLAHTRIIRLE